MHHLNGAKAADIYERMRGDKTNIFMSLQNNKLAIKAFQNTGENSALTTVAFESEC